MRAILRRWLGAWGPADPPVAVSSPSAPLKRVHLDDAGRAEMLARAANPMEAAYYGQDDRRAFKWHHYLELYDRHLGRFRGRAVRVLELGIHQGGRHEGSRRAVRPDDARHLLLRFHGRPREATTRCPFQYSVGRRGL